MDWVAWYTAVLVYFFFKRQEERDRESETGRKYEASIDLTKVNVWKREKKLRQKFLFSSSFLPVITAESTL